MNTKLSIFVICIALLVGAVFVQAAVSQNYESAVTARIVGDSVYDLKRQLTRTSGIDADKAVYVGLQTDPSRVDSILNKMFSNLKLLFSISESKLESEIDRNGDNLVVVNPSSNSESMEKISNLDYDDLRTSSPRSTTGSPKALTQRTLKTPKLS